jgi:hypothetical protein
MCFLSIPPFIDRCKWSSVGNMPLMYVCRDVCSRETTSSNLGCVRNIFLPVVYSLPTFLQSSTGTQPRVFLSEDSGCQFPVGARCSPHRFLSMLFLMWESGRRREANHSSLSNAETNVWKYTIPHTSPWYGVIFSTGTFLPLLCLLPTYCLLKCYRHIRIWIIAVI